MGLRMCLLVNDNLRHVIRLVNQDDSLADLTMLSASSVEATLPREEQELLERREEQEQQEDQEKEQALVVVIPDTTGNKARSFSDQRQSSTDESRYCSGGTEPEPSTEQSSGTESASVELFIRC